jgi:preprotein translocase subunit Sec61beta
MPKTVHRIFIGIMVLTVGLAFILLLINGLEYYRTGLAERAYNSGHDTLKPSGIMGHGLGILGSLLIIIGISSYMVRKRYRFMSRTGLVKYWLEFHIFLCTLGPVLILFHTAFKFGGLVAVSFWSMVAVFLSGIAGRFIYLQIPRSIEGRELDLNEVRSMKSNLTEILKSSYGLDEASYGKIVESIEKKTEVSSRNLLVSLIRNYNDDRKSVHSVRRELKRINIHGNDYRKIVSLVRTDIKLSRRIERLDSMKNLFKYWHVAHLPFALVMLFIMVIHVGVTILFGYRWIF